MVSNYEFNYFRTQSKKSKLLGNAIGLNAAVSQRRLNSFSNAVYKSPNDLTALNCAPEKETLFQDLFQVKIYLNSERINQSF